MVEAWGRSVEETLDVPAKEPVDIPIEMTAKDGTPQQASSGGAARGKLFSRFIVRVGGLPVRLLEELRAPGAMALWREISALDSSLQEARGKLVDKLFEAVGGLEDQAIRHVLLRIKRDLHNDRRLKASLLKKLSGTGLRETGPSGEDLVSGVEQVQEQEARLQDLEAKLEEVFDEEHVAARRRFQEVVQDEDFRRGLQLSSRSLASSLPRYVKAKPAKASTKVRQVERSLMRYFSRTVMKATPFGTLCTILPGRFTEDELLEGAAPVFDGDPRQKTSRLRLNKALYGKLMPLLTKRSEIRRHLHVELNPTLQEEGERFLFLASASGNEVFQRLGRNPVVELFVDLLRRRGHVPLEELLAELCNHPDLEATRDEAESFVDRLMELGLLRFRIGIREQEVHWDGPFQELLAPIEDEHASLARTFVKRLRVCSDAYPRASLSERRQLLDEAQDAIRAVFEGVEGKTPKELPPFYEDAGGVAGLDLSLGSTQECLEEYVSLINRLSFNRSEQANMRAFFDRFYEANPRKKTSPIPLLRFYEDYYREHFKGHLEKQESGGSKSAIPFGIELLNRLQAVRNGIDLHLQTLWRDAPEAEEIVLTREALKSFSSKAPPSLDPCRSASLFCQYVHGFGPGGSPALIADGFLVGYGKYFSRFLYLLPDDFYQEVLAANHALTDQDLAEICGDASFNANLHPPLLPWELSYPTGETGSAEEQIATHELAVERDPVNPHRLRLIRIASGREVIPVDLGFLNPRMRPPLFQLLARFTPVANFGLEMPKGYRAVAGKEASGNPSDLKVGYRPRLTYEGRLILSRRAWTVPGSAFPGRLGGEGEAAYFLRLQRWRTKVGLPDEVFVKLNINIPPAPPKAKEKPVDGASEGLPEVAKAEAQKSLLLKDRVKKPAPIREHLYKPQYVDFSNPLLVDLFSRLGENVESFTLTFEERLPARENLVRSEGERWATEFLLQVNFSGSEDRGQGAGDPGAVDG